MNAIHFGDTSYYYFLFDFISNIDQIANGMKMIDNNHGFSFVAVSATNEYMANAAITKKETHKLIVDILWYLFCFFSCETNSFCRAL